MNAGPTDSEAKYYKHDQPIWRDRANFIINAEVADSNDASQFEQLWVRKVEPNLFELCCIPFFIYDLALGDLVSTTPRYGKSYILNEVVTRSGRSAFRVYFGDSFHPRGETVDELAAIGAMTEWSSTNMVAVDASDDQVASEVARYLQGRHDRQELQYEVGHRSAS